MDQVTATVTAPATARGFLADLVAKEACAEGRAWAKLNKIKSPSEAWAKLERPDWMFWLAGAYGVALDPEQCVVLAAQWADRALHTYAPAALRSAGLTDQAAKLEALPALAGKASSELGDAAWAAWAARDAAWAARDARAAAWAAGDAAGDAAWAAESILQCSDLRLVFSALSW
jgi:hypothetical protein